MAPQVRSVLILLAMSTLLASALEDSAGLRGAVGGVLSSQEAGLHDQMSAMMADDGADDPSDGQGSFLQGGGRSSSAYVEDSAAGLSAALGPRWNGKQLEADARRKTDALLQGIAGHNAAGSLSRMLGALP